MWLDTEQIASLAAALLLLKAHAIRAANVTYWNNITIFPIECPEGSRWTEWTDDFVTGSTRIENPYDEWISARGKPGVHDGTGLPLKLQKETGASE